MTRARRGPLRAGAVAGGARWASPWVMAVVVAGCSSSPVFLPSHDFDRPTDITFTCMELQPPDGAARPATLGAQPMDVCHPPGTRDPLIGAPYSDGNTYKTFAFVPNSNRGDVSVVDMSICRNGDNGCLQKSLQSGAELVDLNPNSIGFASVPVGELPEVIDSSQDGCRIITANRGSCDLTLIDPAALMKPRLLGQDLPASYTKTFMVRTGASTPLHVAPGEVAFVPQQTALPGDSRAPAALCTDLGTLAAPVGEPSATPDNRASWHVVVTFPTCDLIALVDVQSETILDSYRVSTTDGRSYIYQHTGANPVCPRIDCGAGAAGLPAAGGQPGSDQDSGGAGGAGGIGGEGGTGGEGDATGTGGSAPAPSNAVPLDVQPLAIHPDGTRIYFGATNAPVIGTLTLDGHTLSVPTQGASTPLANAGGVVRLRLSIDPYAYRNGRVGRLDPANDPTQPEFGRFVAQTDTTDRRYLYAIGRDASIRIVDVSVDAPTECDVGIDPSAVAPDDPRRKCFPVGARDNPPHLPQIAYLSGLHFPSAPQDVAFAYYWTDPLPNSSTAVNEQILNGAYAFVMTGGGTLYVVNVDPQVRQTQQVFADASGALVAGEVAEDPLPLPNTPRDANVITYTPGLLQSVGPPRADTSTPITTSSGPVLRTFSALTTRENATIVPLQENGNLVAPTSPVQTYVYFPNRATVQPQTWSITWEGDLTGVRGTGDLDLPRTMAVGDPDHLAVALTDGGASFCSTGIFPGDTVTLTGCTTDSNCSPGRVCVHNPDVAPSANGYPINGLCMHVADSTNQKTLKQCDDLLKTFRRYEISSQYTRFSSSGQAQSTVVIVPKKAEIPGVDRCAGAMDGAGCSPGGRPDLSGFACYQGRCLMPCDGKDEATGALAPDNRLCLQRRGSVCVDFSATTGHFFCADGAPLRDQTGFLNSCDLDELVPYSVSAGRAFVVAGTSAGRNDPGTSLELTDAGGNGTGMYQCARDPSAPPSLVSRIPLTIPRCTSPQLTQFTAMTSDMNSPLQPNEGQYNAIFASSALPTPNPCLIEYGAATPMGVAAGGASGGAGAAGGSAGLGGSAGASGDSGAGGAPGGGSGGTTAGATSGAGGAGGGAATNSGKGIPVYSALFQNREIRFVLTNLDTIVGDPVQIRFAVDGGTVAQLVPTAVDSAVGLPARIKLGPVPSVDQSVDLVAPMGGALLSDLPYLFVIDQRNNTIGRSATRGQLLRIAPRQSDTSPVPAYQSAVDSNSYFPIQ